MKKKLLIVSVALALVVSFAVGMTVAYLKSTPDPVENTFTVGKVEITLDEAKVNEYGEPVTPAERVKTNSYLLLPGHQYTKDPTVHVQPGSEACFVFIKVVDPFASIEAAATVAEQITANGWTALGTDYPGVYYKTQAKVNSGDSAVDLKVFETFKIDPNQSDLTAYNNQKITVTAYAIQQDGFEGSATSAWAALNP